MERVTCQINPKTGEKFECADCPVRDACIQDMCDDYTLYVVEGAAELGRKIARVLKEIGGL